MVQTIASCRPEGPQDERCGGVAEGQTEPAKLAKGRANSEPQSIATRPQGGTAPKK